MRLPIKLNRAGWPASFGRLSFVFDDPRPLAKDLTSLSPVEFSAAISTLQFGVTFKTTHPGRQEYSDRHVLNLYRGSRPVILDVGASDGSTSLDLIRRLGHNFDRYYVTDLNLFTSFGYHRGVLYFLDQHGRCTLRASQRFIVYSDTERAQPLLSKLAQWLISRSRKVRDWREILLIQPELINLASEDRRVSILPYDMFTPWKGETPDLIKIANLLNGKYFSAAQMRQAVAIQCANLAVGGRLLLVSEDDGIEKFSVFRKTEAGMILEHTHGGGAKAAPYVPLPDDVRNGIPAGKFAATCASLGAFHQS